MYGTVNDLYEALEALVDEGMGDAKLRVASQPNWPIANVVTNVGIVYDFEESSEERVWIAIDQVSSWSENPYAPKEAWDL